MFITHIYYIREVKTFSTKTSRDVGSPDGAKCLQRTHVPAWENQLVEKLQEQGGVPFHAQRPRLTFSDIKDTLDTCSPSLHLVTF